MNHLLQKIFSPETSHSDQFKMKAHLLIRMRVVAGSFQALAVFPGIYYRYIPEGYVFHYIGIVTLLSLFNAWSFLSFQKAENLTDQKIFFQLLLDLCALTGLLYYSGGWNNPFVSLFYFHAFIGPFLLPMRYSIRLFGVLVLCMAACFQWTCSLGGRFWQVNLPKNLILIAELLIALVLWMLSYWLAQSLGRLQDNLKILSKRNARFDRLRAVGALAASFSHQLATPLNNVGMRLDRLQRRHLHLENDNDLASVLSSVGQCHKILKDFFAESPDLRTVAVHDTEMGSFVRTVCEAWMCENSDVRLRKCIPDQKIMLMIPRLSMTRTLMDLLDNAKESQSNRSGPEITLKLALSDNGSDLLITIIDKGPGFKPVILERLGEPFLTQKEDGTGLGLFTAFGLVHSLSGEIIAQNLPGQQGASVEIRLPVPSDLEQEL